MAIRMYSLDYYRLMLRINRFISGALLAATFMSGALAAPAATNTPLNSNLDSEVLYELLVGELSAQAGDAATAYSMLLNAARKSKSPQLFERTVDLALRARSGDSALEAARAWLQAFPASKEANRYVLQILIGLNRISETPDAIERELATLAPKERAAAMGQLPRYFVRATDRKQVAATVERALARDLTNRITGASAWAAVGVLRLQSGDANGALEAARRGAALDSKSQEPILLGIALLDSKMPDAEAIVIQYLAHTPSTEVRMGYTRSLLNAQRFSDAYTQMQILNTEKPNYAEAWLVRGSLELQDKKPALAEKSLNTYVALTQPAPESSAPAGSVRGLMQAYFLLAQIAEQERRLDDAVAYLAPIEQLNENAQDGMRLVFRQAAILAKRGKLEEARALIRALPEPQPDDARAKMNAELQLLRENKQYATAYQLLGDAIARAPKDYDLLFEQSILAEKLGKLGEMEQLLRQVISGRPDHHQAYNALGYSLADRNIRLVEARALIVKSLEYAPNDPFITDSLAWVEYRLGNSAEALRLLQGAYAARPDAEIAAHLGEVLWVTGQRDQARAMWQEGLALNPENETLLETIRRMSAVP